MTGLGVLFALAHPAACEALGDDRGPGPLPWRVGGPVPFTVDAAAFPDSAGLALDVYVRIPPATLAGLARDEGADARLRLSARLRNRFGARQHDATEEFAVAAGDTGAGFGKVVILRFPGRPGPYRLMVRLEDLQSRKRGLAYVGRKVNRSGQVEGDVVVPAPQAGREISDAEFVWSEPANLAPAAFRRNGHAVLPNPERLYGLLAPELRAAFVARGPDSAARAWRWSARVLDAQGNLVAERDSTAAPAPVLKTTVALDLSTAPAGGYDLELRAWQEGDRGALERRAHFSVAWQAESWYRSPGELEDLVHFLLEPDQEELFSRLEPGEQESYLETFWRRRDPTPETAENEARTSFHRRIEYANRAWGRIGMHKGMFSDMGRVYIRYGEPTEVLRQVIPAGDQTLSQVLQQLELSEDRPTGDVATKGLGGDQRPFEIWVYEGERDRPVTADPSAAINARPRKRLLFLFVDEHGYGEYTLRYSTE